MDFKTANSSPNTDLFTTMNEEGKNDKNVRRYRSNAPPLEFVKSKK
jgi:hypothetical protein